jgi:hypothetical protein
MMKAISPGIKAIGKLLQTTKGKELPTAKMGNSKIKKKLKFAPAGIKGPKSGMVV